MSDHDLARDVLMLAELVNEIDAAVHKGAVGDDLDRALTIWATLEASNAQLAIARANLAALLAEDMPEKRLTVMGVGTFEKHRKADRKKWAKDDLLRSVLDTRLVDTGTGELVEEAPIDKVLAVWNLGAPRVTALRDRGLDPDEFCETEYGALTLQLVTS